MSNARHLYTGRAGQLAVMAEFLLRGYNAATPEVDRGDDIFVVNDGEGDLFRIQVKTAKAKKTKSGLSGQFKVSIRQLETLRTPDLHYVFAARAPDRWADFVVISRKDLYALHTLTPLSTPVDNGRCVLLKLDYTNDDVRCTDHSLQAHRNDWSRWPKLEV